MASDFAGRLRDARSNLSHWYAQLNAEWKRAESILRDVRISRPVYVCFQVESQGEASGRAFEHCLLYTEVRGEWRICYSSGEANDPDSHCPKPILECSAAERKRALKGLPLLQTAILEEVEREAAEIEAELGAAAECRTQIAIALRTGDNAPEVHEEMTVRDVVKMIEADGWYLVVARGSHRQFKHPTKPGRVTVAGKPSDDVPPGTLNSILKQAGLKG